jgi:hypothetical protein
VIAGAIGRSVGGYEEAKHGMEETAAVEGFKLTRSSATCRSSGTSDRCSACWAR